MEKEFFEDYVVGEKFVSPGRTITETDIVLFASLTGDWHPIHTNKEYASQTMFHERIAHGALTFAIGTALGFRLGPYVVLPKSFIALRGFDKVRFLQPVKIGDTIRSEMEIIGKEDKEGQGIVFVKMTVFNQMEQSVLTLESSYLCGTSRGGTQEPVEETND